jgi:hypothetical protein
LRRVEINDNQLSNNWDFPLGIIPYLIDIPFGPINKNGTRRVIELNGCKENEKPNLLYFTCKPYLT